MTEREKRDAGLLYDANSDAGLLAERLRCKELCETYNRLRPTQRAAEGEALLRQLLGSVAGSCWIEPVFWCDYGYNISVGENFYANHNCVILDAAPVTFGSDVFIGPDCGFYTSAHPLDAALRCAGLETALPIEVGDRVWIGGGTRVLPGVRIGSGSVIGAGSVVTKDIPARVVAVGNPCRVLRPIEQEKEKDDGSISG